jgi:hypothetical protein
MSKQRMLCLECGHKNDDGQNVCPEDGTPLVSTIISNYELLDRLSSDVETVTYSAKHRKFDRKNLRITLRKRTDAEAAEEFIRYARDTAKSESRGGTTDLGLSDDGAYMFVVYDPFAIDEVQHPTIEQSILLTETVTELMNARNRHQDPN